MIAFAIALAAAAPGAPVPRLIHCRMMECAWSRSVSSGIVRSTPDGVLRRITEFRGTSAYREDPPTVFHPSIRVNWEKRANTNYVFCSRSRPAMAFRSGRRWVAHALDLFDLPGYQIASAITYLRACHGLDFGRADADQVMRRLGYRPGTRSEQIEIARPEQLVALPPRARP